MRHWIARFIVTFWALVLVFAGYLAVMAIPEDGMKILAIMGGFILYVICFVAIGISIAWGIDNWRKRS